MQGGISIFPRILKTFQDLPDKRKQEKPLGFPCVFADKVRSCHCEPARTLVWQSVFPENRIMSDILPGRRIPTPVLRHWLGMTGVEAYLHIDAQFSLRLARWKRSAVSFF